MISTALGLGILGVDELEAFGMTTAFIDPAFAVCPGIASLGV